MGCIQRNDLGDPLPLVRQAEASERFAMDVMVFIQVELGGG
jgi:hypothetical protein